jgi:hypothetical protein
VSLLWNSAGVITRAMYFDVAAEIPAGKQALAE